MARVTQLSTPETRTIRQVVTPLITDYLSQTETVAQVISSPVTFSKTRFPAKYTVYADGSYYRVMKDDGSMSLPSTDSLSVAVNDEAFNGLTAGRTAQEKVLLEMGGAGGTLDNPITPEAYTHLELNGKITLANGVNDSMIKNLHPATNDPHVIIESGVWDCNHDNQTDGNCIYWEHGTDPADPNIWSDIIFRHMRIYHVYRNAIRMMATSSLYLGVVQIEDICTVDDFGFPAIYAEHIHDSVVRNCFAIGAISWEHSGNVHIFNNYINGLCKFTGCNRVEILGGIIDTAGTDGVQLAGTAHSRISPSKISCQGDGAETLYAVSLLDDGVGNHATNNRVGEFKCGRDENLVPTRRFAYAAHEADANQDRNIYYSIDGTDCTVGAIRQLGVNGKPRANPCDSIIGTVVLV